MKRFIAIALTGSLLAVGVRPARSNPALVAPAICAGTAGIGCVFVGVAVLGGIAYNVWWNRSTREHYHIPVLASRPRKPRVTPGQMELFPTDDSDIVITTHDQCKALGGWRFVPDRSLGLQDGKNIGRCYVKKGG
jgi:hypothetical protein